MAEALGYSAERNAISRHVSNEDKLTHRISASGQMRTVTIINESGLYSLILSSKLEKASMGYSSDTPSLVLAKYSILLPLPRISSPFFLCNLSICSILILSRSEGGIDMKKNLKKYLVILLAAIMIFSLPLSASAATKKNVTKTYKKSVTRMLRGFDSYFGYCCGKNQYFKFDDYARTTMVLMRNYPSDNRLSTVKKKLRPQLKLYFNTSTVKFK